MFRRMILLAGLALMLTSCGRVITITVGTPGVNSVAAAPAPPASAPPASTPPASATPVSAAQVSALPRGYELLFSPAPHAFRYSRPGEPVRRGAVSERFELRDGDCGGSDCANPRARAEIRQSDNAVRARLNRDIWYGWSFYNQNIGTVTPDTSLGAVFGQWKLGGEQPAIFRILQTVPGAGTWDSCDPAICNRAGAPDQDVVVELSDMAQARGWGEAQNFGNVCRLFSMAQNRGKWVDIVVNTNFATDAEGYLRIWVNGALKCNYYGPLVSPASALQAGAAPNHRRGIFASSTRRWLQKQPGTAKPTLIVYYDEFRIGKTRGDVDTRAREAAGRKPVN